MTFSDRKIPVHGRSRIAAFPRSPIISPQPMSLFLVAYRLFVFICTVDFFYQLSQLGVNFLIGMGCTSHTISEALWRAPEGLTVSYGGRVVAGALRGWPAGGGGGWSKGQNDQRSRLFAETV